MRERTCVTTVEQVHQEKHQLRTAGSEDLLRSLQIVKYLSKVSDRGSHTPRKIMIEVHMYPGRALQGELV